MPHTPKHKMSHKPKKSMAEYHPAHATHIRCYLFFAYGKNPRKTIVANQNQSADVEEGEANGGYYKYILWEVRSWLDLILVKNERNEFKIYDN